MTAFLHEQPWWYWVAFLAVCAIAAFFIASALVAWVEGIADDRDRKVWEAMPGAVSKRAVRPADPWNGFLPAEIDDQIIRRDRDRAFWDARAADGLADTCLGILASPADAARIGGHL